MPLNVPGIFAPFHALVRSRLVIPTLTVKDIRQIDFAALHKHGYRGVVFDKDNCLTLPHHDTIVPAIEDAWYECRETFGQGNVIIVSNTAGTWVDPGGIQSESVSYHLGVPVLQHKRFKPSYSCISDIRSYFSSLRSPIRDEELVVVGDRIFTDIVMANRMRYWKPKPKPNGNIFGIAASCAFEKGGAIETEKEVASEIAKLTKGSCGPLAIWTTGVWEKEALLMRCAEKLIVKAVQRRLEQDEFGDTSKFLKPMPVRPKKPNIIDRFLHKVYSV